MESLSRCASINGEPERHHEAVYCLCYPDSGKRIWEVVGKDPDLAVAEKTEAGTDPPFPTAWNQGCRRRQRHHKGEDAGCRGQLPRTNPLNSVEENPERVHSHASATRGILR